MGLTDPETRPALAGWLASALGAKRAAIDALRPLSGGAIQENWALDLTLDGGPLSGQQALVLRLDAPSTLPVSHGRTAEFRLLQVAFEAGVTVPEPLALYADPALLGRPFFVMRRAPGRTDPRALTAAAPHPGLAASLGGELARLHRIGAPRAGIEVLGAPPADPARTEIARLRALLDGIDAAEPALEWGLNWLEARAPEPVRPVLCHRDFRTGNYLVEDGRLTALLDWEFAGWSEPAADLGWFCAPCWRFTRPDLPAGGIGTRGELYAGYAAEAPLPADERVRYWEVMATARWAVIALLQSHRQEPSLELALTGHLVPELTLDLLNMTRP